MTLKTKKMKTLPTSNGGLIHFGNRPFSSLFLINTIAPSPENTIASSKNNALEEIDYFLKQAKDLSSKLLRSDISLECELDLKSKKIRVLENALNIAINHAELELKEGYPKEAALFYEKAKDLAIRITQILPDAVQYYKFKFKSELFATIAKILTSNLKPNESDLKEMFFWNFAHAKIEIILKNSDDAKKYFSKTLSYGENFANTFTTNVASGKTAQKTAIEEIFREEKLN